MTHTETQAIVVLGDIDQSQIICLLREFGLELAIVPPKETIPGSFWGEPEAGLIGDRLYARDDTPLHSILHETCHFICMDPARRASLDTNAGGDYEEENAVCYLQILLAEHIPRFGSARCMKDMDAWGYSFRLGSARAWFERDADDAQAWLKERSLLDGICKTVADS